MANEWRSIQTRIHQTPVSDTTAIAPSKNLRDFTIKSPHPTVSDISLRIKELPDDPESWLDDLGNIDELTSSLQTGNDRSVFSSQIIRAFFDKVAGNPAFYKEISLTASYALTKAARLSAKIDKMSGQEELARRQNTSKSTFEHDLSGLCLRIPEMASADMDVKTENGRTSLRYFNKTVYLNPPCAQASRARELLAGNALFIEDEKGNALGIVSPDFDAGLNKAEYKAVFYDTSQNFATGSYYGKAASIEDIKAYLDDKDFQEQLQSERLINSRINLSALPLFGRVRARKMLLDTATSGLAEKIISNLGEDGLFLFQILDESELPDVLSMIDYLGEQIDHKLARTIVSSARLIGEFVHSSNGNNRSKNIARLLEDKVRLQFLEAARLYKVDNQTMHVSGQLGHFDDWDAVGYSFDALAKTAMAISHYELGKEFPLKDVVDPRLILRLFEFSGRHPLAKTIFQSLFDYLLVRNIEIQRKSPYAGQIAQVKRDFYKAFVSMNETVPTTNSETDIARTTGLISKWYKEKPRTEKPRMLVCGCGNTKRFESYVIRNLKGQGMEFSDILGVDLEDYGDQIHPDLNMRFKQGDIFRNEKFLDEGKFDVILLPWSMINDQVEKAGLVGAIQSLRKFINKDGIIIMDIPLPVGTHSYAKTIEEQADLWGVWGIMERDFANGDANLRSIFDIMHIRELFMHLAHAGMLPDNFPWNFASQERICRQISTDDSILHSIHELRQDHDASKYPIYQTNGYNRGTFALRFMDYERVEKLTGLNPSVFIAGLYGLDGYPQN